MLVDPEPLLLFPELLDPEPMLPELLPMLSEPEPELLPMLSELEPELLFFFCFLCFFVVVWPDWSVVLVPDCPIVFPELELPDWPMELSGLLEPDCPIELPELPDCPVEPPELPDCANAHMPAVNINANARVKSFFMKSNVLYLDL